MRGGLTDTLLAVAVVVALCGCGTKSPCSAMDCEGCCDASGVCLAGTAFTACGSAGGMCKSCAANTACLGGECVQAVACTTTDQCTMVPCHCGDGASIDTRSCAGNRCRTPAELCDGACTASGHPKPGSGDGGTPGYSFCVDGTASSCFGSDLDWSGNKCCVTVGYGQCVNGTAASCFGPDLEWTGATCCVKSPYGQCTDGTTGACSGDAMEWTGAQCCVKDAFYLCTEGTATSCGSGELTWTGTKCCALSEYTHCVEGSANSCQGQNMRWTGAKCCVKNRSDCADGQPGACGGDWTGSKCCT